MKRYRLLAIFLVVCLLAGCGGASIPSGSISAAPSAASSAPVPPPAETPSTISMPLAETSAPESIGNAAAVFNEDDFNEYLSYFSSFFFETAAAPEDLKPDYYMAFFLLHTAYLESEKGLIPKLEMNEEYFHIVPDAALTNVAGTYLGMADFDLSRITEWPMGADAETGEKYYSTESSPPHGNTKITNVTVQGEKIVATAAVNPSLDETVDHSTTKIYSFIRVANSNGDAVYQLISIE